MKKLTITLGLLLALFSCKRETLKESIRPPLDEGQNLILLDLRQTKVNGFSFKDIILNPDSLVGSIIDTMGQTVIFDRGLPIDTFLWQRSAHGGNIFPTRIQATVFSEYALILTANGLLETPNKLIVQKNHEFWLSCSINTITVKKIIHKNGRLEILCSNAQERNPFLPDYWMVVDL